MGSASELDGSMDGTGLDRQIPDAVPLTEQAAGPDDELLGLMDTATDTPKRS